MDFPGEPINIMEILKRVHLTFELTPFSGIMQNTALMCRGGVKQNPGEFCEDQQYNCEFLVFSLPIQLYFSFVLFCSAMENLLPIYTPKKGGGTWRF